MYANYFVQYAYYSLPGFYFGYWWFHHLLIFPCLQNTMIKTFYPKHSTHSVKLLSLCINCHGGWLVIPAFVGIAMTKKLQW